VFAGQSQVPASNYVVQSITTDKTGRLDVTVDWVYPVNVISWVLTQAPCSLAQFHADHCNVILNLFPPPKPLEGSTYWLSAGRYDLIIGNFGSIPDTTSTRVVLSSTGCQAPNE